MRQKTNVNLNPPLHELQAIPSFLSMNRAMNFPAHRWPKTLVLVSIFFVISLSTVKAQSMNNQNSFSSSQDGTTNFEPSLAVVVGVLCIMFSLTSILLIYAKFCHRPASPRFNQNGLGLDDQDQPTSRRFSGIDKSVIESLPFFRFSALKGTREGLECAVCLSKFEDIEILRLLPKCKHAFHIDCVDQWLEKHSSCPLCRHKVSEDDLVFTYSNSLRFLRDQSENSNLEIYVQREESTRFDSGRSISSSRRFEKGNNEEESRNQENLEIEEILHKFNHTIIVSDSALKNRWSNVSSSDLIYLKSEMIKEEMGWKREPESKISIAEILQLPSDSPIRMKPSYSTKKLSKNEQRSMSEIVVHSRFTDFRMPNSNTSKGDVDQEDDRQRRLWLPIARRTVEWFANREKRPQQLQMSNTNESLHV